MNPLDQKTAGRARFELVALLITGGLHLVFEGILDAKAYFIPLAAIFWLGYVAFQVRREPAILRTWGFRTDTLRQAALAASAVSLPSAGFLILLASYLGNPIFSIHIIPLFLLYPVWGLVQQFLLQALLARNILHLLQNRWAAVLLGALLFGLVHLPDWTLCGLTFALGLIYVPIYLRWPNLYPLGIYHGWLGALAYFGVLGRDPWAEILAQLGR